MLFIIKLLVMKKLLLFLSLFAFTACDTVDTKDEVGPEDCPVAQQVDLGKPSPLNQTHGVFNASLILDIALGNNVEGVASSGIERACALWRADYDGDGTVTEDDAQAYFDWYMDVPTVDEYHTQACPGVKGDIDNDGITPYDAVQIRNISNNTINVRTVYPDTHRCVVWRADFDGDLAVEYEDADKLLIFLED